MAKVASKRENQHIALEPDAWSRFERFIRDIAKAGPQHRNAGQKKSARATAVRRRPKAKYDKNGNLIRATAD
jgi:hypothetical protein